MSTQKIQDLKMMNISFSSPHGSSNEKELSTQLNWSAAWVYIFLSASFQIFGTLILVRMNPEIVNVRGRKPREFPPFDNIILPSWMLSQLIGLVLAVVFGAAGAYVGFKLGVAMAASIPAAVISTLRFRAMDGSRCRARMVVRHTPGPVTCG